MKKKKTKKTKSNKKSEETTGNQKNTNWLTMKLLTNNESFMNHINRIRKEIEKEINMADLCYIPTLDQQDYKIIIKDSEKTKMIDELMKKRVKEVLDLYNLPANFNTSMAFYILYKVPMVPAYNFSIKLERENGKITGFNIIVHSKGHLTTKEKNLRNEKEEKLSNLLFKDNLPKRNLTKIDRDLEITKEMKERKRIIEEAPDWYLRQVKKQHGEKAYEQAKKLNPQRIEKKKVHHTSKDIAKKLLDNKKKDNTIRVINCRTKRRISRDI